MIWREALIPGGGLRAVLQHHDSRWNHGRPGACKFASSPQGQWPLVADWVRCN